MAIYAATCLRLYKKQREVFISCGLAQIVDFPVEPPVTVRAIKWIFMLFHGDRDIVEIQLLKAFKSLLLL